MEGMINPPWIMACCHEEEVLDLLKTFDADKAAREQVKQEKVVDQKAVTEAQQAEKTRLADIERERKKQEKASTKAAVEKEMAEWRAQKRQSEPRNSTNERHCRRQNLSEQDSHRSLAHPWSTLATLHCQLLVVYLYMMR
jgi:hypothetical protein